MKEGFRVERNPSFCITGADSGFRRTNGFHPRLRVSAGLRFAVRSLSEAIDRESSKSGAWVGTSSTANAVPLPLIGEGLTPGKVGVTVSAGAHFFRVPAPSTPLHKQTRLNL